ncbi:MAG: tRNA 2-thiouridine(34) synthase MnmA [Planctomyces sp.]
MKGRVVLAMSGGVDSSAAAVLLHQQGYQVIGLFMRSGESESACAVTKSEPEMSVAGSNSDFLPIINSAAHRQGCCSSEDAADARRVADRLGIPFHSLDFQDSFRRIKDYFADEYLAGRTPNPCVQCNNWLKFGKLWDFARQVDADHIATGHYARILPVSQNPPNGTSESDLHGNRSPVRGLYRGLDDQKDQSYVLFGISRDLLDHILLPIGTFQKPEIRALAADAGLRVATKKDSYEICFVPNNDYSGFLKRYRDYEGTSGDFVDSSGNLLGHHDGYEQFTVGQRKGLGIAFGEPRFVIRIDASTRQVVLGRAEELLQSEVFVQGLSWLADVPFTPFRCEVKVRYRHTARPCTVHLKSTAAGSVGHAASSTVDGSGSSSDECSAIVIPDEPITGVAPGQAAVFYDGDRVLGGGWISSGNHSPVG